MDSTKSGLLGILLLIIGVLLIFFTLNYFNILSLSALYPNLFASLPHKQIIKVKKPPPTLPIPQRVQNEIGIYSVNALFDSNTLNKIVASNSIGLMSLNYDKNTALLRVDTSKKPAQTTQFSDSEAFFKQIKKGDLLFIVYSNLKSSPLYAQQIQYMSFFNK